MTAHEPFAHWRRAVAQRAIPPQGAEPGILPPAFQFSQNNLQAYVDCARRFQLRHIEGQQWPAAESEPLDEYEHFAEQGTQFHLLVQRHLSGLPVEVLAPHDELLNTWWENYLRTPPPDLPTGLRLPEIQLSTPLAGRRLLARFDLLAFDPDGRAVIVDWKTTRHRPKRSAMSARLQTRIYPFVLAEAGERLFGSSLRPEQISLIYWFADTPTELEIFTYDTVTHEANRDYLSGLIREVLARDEAVWPLTEVNQHCRYCVYRSLCDRGVKAGDMREAEVEADLADFEIDLDRVEEIAF